MKKVKSEYHYLTQNGELKGLQKRIPNFTKETFLVLDSSVCLDILNLINKKNINKESKRKAIDLVRFLQKKGLEIFEFFALFELCYDKSKLELDEEKFDDFNYKIHYAFNIPFEKLRDNQFDTPSQKHLAPDPIKNNISSLMINQLLIYYCGILKIKNIAQGGIGKKYGAEKAKKNIFHFIDWMDSKLGIVLGLEYMLAVNIFGGNDLYRPMIGDNLDKDKVLKVLWGTAWDLFHARLSRNDTQLSKIVSRDVNSIFVTNDKRLYGLLAPDTIIFSEYDQSKITYSNPDPKLTPLINDTLAIELKERILEIIAKRKSQNPVIPDNQYIKKLIMELEQNIT